MSSFLYYISSGGPTGEPRGGDDLYRYLQGRWKDGTPMWVGGDGYGGGRDTTMYSYSGLPPHYWSEFDPDGRGSKNLPGDRRFVVGHGPFRMEPEQTVEIRFALVWARSDLGHLPSLYRLLHEAAPASVSVSFEPDPALATIRPEDLPRLPEVVEPPVLPARAGLAASAWPSPASGATVIRYDLAAEAAVRLDVVDALGRGVAVLAEGVVPAGEHRAEVDVGGWAPGAYVYRLRLGGRLAGTGRLVVAR